MNVRPTICFTIAYRDFYRSAHYSTGRKSQNKFLPWQRLKSKTCWLTV